jgi:hypothetical protein
MGFGLLARLAQEIEGMAPWDIQRAHIIGDQMTEELAFLIKMIERESGHTSA